MIIHSIPPSNSLMNKPINMVLKFNVLNQRYEFTETEYILIELDPRSVYILDSLTITGTITNEQLISSRSDNMNYYNRSTELSMKFEYKNPKQRAQHFPNDIYLSGIDHTIQLSKEFYSSDSNDYLKVIPQGYILQTADLVNEEYIIVTVTPTIYRMTGQHVVDGFKKRLGQ